MPELSNIQKLISRISFYARLLALIVAIVPITAFLVMAYIEAISGLKGRLYVQSFALTDFISERPESWDISYERLQAHMDHYIDEKLGITIFNANGEQVFHQNPAESGPTLTRSIPIYDFGHVAGRIQGQLLIKRELQIGFVILLLSIICAWFLWGPGRSFPLQAMLEAERKLYERDHYQRALLNNFPFLVWLLDDMGHFLSVNKAFFEHTGITSIEELSGKTDTNIATSDLFKELKKCGAFNSNDLDDKTIEMWTDEDGSRQCYEIIRSPLLVNGITKGLVGYAQNITDRKQNESILQHAKLEAEEASNVKSRFLANMSHEIRTPINGIFGMLQLLAATDVNKEQKGYVNAATRSTTRLTNLLSDILDLSRVEAGKMILDTKSFSMNDQKASVLDSFSTAAQEKGLQLSFNIDDAIPAKLLGPEVRIRQILFNLIGNSIKFTKQGHVTASATLLPTSTETLSRILFSVEDSGMGIPDEKKTEIFQSFVQVDKAYVRNSQGAGLGLSIVAQLIKLMGGSLEVHGNEGEGTSIYFSLSFTVPDEQELQKTPEIQTAPIYNDLNILLVEDDNVNSIFGQRMLEKSGHTVTVCNNGKEAVDLHAQNSFDLILMDIQMPVMDGMEATRKIRETDTTIPIIAMTAYTMKGDKEQFLASGMTGYISKPLEIDQLINLITRKVENRKADLPNKTS